MRPSSSWGINKRKMKFATGVLLTFGVTYLTFASVHPHKGESLRPNIPYESFSKEVVVDKANINTLQLVQVVFRHGDRTPIERYPKDPYDSKAYWGEGRGQLTDRGKQMQFKLGQYIRARYDGFLGKKFRPEEIYVKSSDLDRSIISAMANLAGMWPATEGVDLGERGRQQFVPIHTVPLKSDNKMLFTKHCPSYKKEVSTIMKHPAEVEFNAKQTELYKYLSEHTGLAITSYKNVSDIYDILYCQSCHNLTLPNWTLSIFPDKLRVFAEKWVRWQIYTSTMLKLRAGPLLTEFVANMKRAKDKLTNETDLKALEVLLGTPAAKMYVYSGHDTTLTPILDALELYDGNLPPYAASLYLELHEDSGEFFVKLFYRPDLNGRAEELKLKNCASTPCVFEDFMTMLKDYMMDEEEWERQCSVHN